MRIVMTAALVAAVLGSGAASAQGGGNYMWCAAWADNGTEKTYFYSGFFAAEAWQAERKALAFKSEVEDEEISAAKVTATCMPPAEYNGAVATRNAAMKGAPGKVLNWEG